MWSCAFQGGHNAGHTLQIDNQTFKLSLLPSGIVRQDKLSIIGNGVVVNPWALFEEIERVKKQGLVVGPDNLLIAENASFDPAAARRTGQRARGTARQR